MPELASHHVDRDAPVEQVACRRVPQIVEPDRWKSQGLDNGAARTGPERASVRTPALVLGTLSTVLPLTMTKV